MISMESAESRTSRSIAMHPYNITSFLDYFSGIGKTISCAESCTGGLIGATITSVPGASSVFLGGVVSYSNDIKRSLLNVPEEELSKFGAVSIQVAKSMARGVSKLTGSDFSVATTGIAGPGGAVPGKPVGTVCIGVSDGCRSLASVFCFKGNRDEVRIQATYEAISMLVDFAEGKL